MALTGNIYCCSDEIMISIPNADLLKERLSNLSRVRHSQVKQVLRLRYDDVDKIPSLIEQIKYEFLFRFFSIAEERRSSGLRYSRVGFLFDTI